MFISLFPTLMLHTSCRRVPSCAYCAAECVRRSKLYESASVRNSNHACLRAGTRNERIFAHDPDRQARTLSIISTIGQPAPLSPARPRHHRPARHAITGQRSAPDDAAPATKKTAAVSGLFSLSVKGSSPGRQKNLTLMSSTSLSSARA